MPSTELPSSPTFFFFVLPGVATNFLAAVLPPLRSPSPSTVSSTLSSSSSSSSSSPSSAYTLAFALAFSAASKIMSRSSLDISVKEAWIADTVRAAVRGSSGVSIYSSASTCVSSTITSSIVSSTTSSFLTSDIVFSFRDYSLERKCSKPADCFSSEKVSLDFFTSVSPSSIVWVK